MNKNLTWKIVFIILLAVVSVWTLYPPQKTLKPGIDLAGGTSLIYEIDTTGLSSDETKNLASRMITILRRRVDPANIQNLVWRPQGNTRFEIQMPLATAEAREKRQQYEDVLNKILSENVSPAAILRALNLSEEKRQEVFNRYANGDENRLEILNNLAKAYDKLQAMRNKSEILRENIEKDIQKLQEAGFDVEFAQNKVGEWYQADKEELNKQLEDVTQDDPNHVKLLKDYISDYGKWAKVIDQINDPETGEKIEFEDAKRQLDALNLTQDQLVNVLSMPEDSIKRKEEIEKLKNNFPARKNLLDELVSTYREYKPYQGRLDDPKDLQRMLKGAGILEFRILPTTDGGELSQDEISNYIQKLINKGPKYASDSKYVWVPVDDPDEWQVANSIVSKFGDEYYVLASNRTEKHETMVQTGQTRWKLKKAYQTTDQMGRRAIGFTLDERGGRIFGKVTSNNMQEPLCILLDGRALSAPNIQSKITTRGQITGSFTQTEVRDMINKLNAGSLPARLIEQPISVKSIGPSIGEENRDKGIKSGLIGFAVVAVCMLCYYLLAGAVADIALILNLLFVLTIMAVINATFTLPGIAGIILTIGMSVDANVLIFERIREEQAKGSSLFISIKNGYQKAFRTILDANLTTFITAAILLWVASEEIKGFAIVLMLGILSSMFTALFVTRVNFDWLRAVDAIKDHLKLFLLFEKPNINWMKLRGFFITLSLIVIAAGMFVFFNRDEETNSKYDIEFTGGTSVQINFKEGVSISRQEVESNIHQVGKEMGNPALATANVYSVGESGNQYEITTTETNKTIADITFGKELSAEDIRTKLTKASGKLTNLNVEQDPENPQTYTVETSYPVKLQFKQILEDTFPEAGVSEPEVVEVVNEAILEAFGDQLALKQNLEPAIADVKMIDEATIETYPELSEFIGGIIIKTELGKPATLNEIDRRIKDLRFKPATRDLEWYPYRLLGGDLEKVEEDKETDSFSYVSVSPEAAVRDLREAELSEFIENEKNRVKSATELETSLPRVTQINPSIGAEAKTQALVAIVLSLFAIIAYIWVRFGNIRYGVAAIAALVHDVFITLGVIVSCTYIAGTPIGDALLIGDFKISLALIAAFLTIIGYSLNDTIVVFDRIRENRKKGNLNPGLINESVNQTISRTLLTSFTTFIVVLIMYIFGGEGLRGFTFAIGLGVIVGTYSSIAIAAPILLIGYKGESGK